MDSQENTGTNEGNEQSRSHGKRSKRLLWFGIGLVIIILLALGIVGAWLYTGQLTSVKQTVFKKTPLPAAVVETKFVPAKEIFNRFSIAQELLGKEQADAQRTELYQKILEQLIADAQSEIQARSLKVSTNDPEINNQYDRLVAQLAGGNKEEFEAAIKQNYKLTPEAFKSEVIRPEILLSKMQIWYNNQKDFDKATYDKADEVQMKLKNGEAFGELAKQYSDDEGTKNIEGDAGTIAISDMLPEFQSTLVDAKTGDVIQVSSRYGQHIIKVMERDESEGVDKLKLRLQQIFLKQDGFAQWYDEQIKQIKVYNLLKF